MCCLAASFATDVMSTLDQTGVNYLIPCVNHPHVIENTREFVNGKR